MTSWAVEEQVARLQEVHCFGVKADAFGERCKWDTSEHDWLEGRGPVRYWWRMIDDATSGSGAVS